MENTSTILNKVSEIIALFPNRFALLTKNNWSHLSMYSLLQILFFHVFEIFSSNYTLDERTPHITL